MVLQVGVKVLLKNKEGNILLLKRSQKYGKYGGVWDIPGGRINVGSPLLENLQREVSEETTLKITSVPALIGAQDLMFGSIPGEEKHVVRLTYTAHTEGEIILDTEENTEYKWLSFGELSQEENLDTGVRALLTEGKLRGDSW